MPIRRPKGAPELPITETYEVRDPLVLQQLRELENPTISNKLSIEYFLTAQLIRCFNALTDPESNFGDQVMALGAIMPSYLQERLDKYLEDECTESNEIYEYRYFAGVALGTPNSPIRDDTGEPVSPVKTTQTNIDYVKFFREILKCLEEMRMTWKPDRTTMEVGKDRPPLELPIEIRKQAEEKLQELTQICRESLGINLTYYDLVVTLVPPEPPKTPTFDEMLDEEGGEEINIGEEKKPELDEFSQNKLKTNFGENIDASGDNIEDENEEIVEEEEEEEEPDNE